MKKLLLFCLIIPSVSFSQVILKKSITIAKLSGGVHPVQVDRDVIQGDTVYFFIFQNRKYEAITDVISMIIKKKELWSFSKALTAAQTVQVDDAVMMDNYSITKHKVGFGNISYWLHYGNGYCYMSEKELRKLQDALSKE